MKDLTGTWKYEIRTSKVTGKMLPPPHPDQGLKSQENPSKTPFSSKKFVYKGYAKLKLARYGYLHDQD